MRTSHEERIDIDELCHFTDKQKEASRLVKKHKYVLYGGAMGGGKSYFLRWKLTRILLAFAARGHFNVTVGLFCENYPALEGRHISKARYEFPEWLGSYNAAEHNFTLYPEFGGGVIAFRNLDDVSKYKSSEFAVIAVDELTNNSEEVFSFLRTRLRWPGISDPKFIGATNPGDKGHTWVKKLWIDKVFPEYEKEKDQFIYLPAFLTDNPHINTSEYMKSLESLPEKRRKAFLQGDWDIFEGQYFTEWDKERHVIPPFPIPESWRKFRAYDHGRSSPACCLWGALDYDGRVWIYRELYQAGWDVDQLAAEIIRLSEGESYQYSVADPSIFARTGMIDKRGGATIAESFANHGVQFIPASNRRIDGWNMVHQYLRWDDRTSPKLFFFNTCYNSIRTIPGLVHSEEKPEDLDTNSDDHCIDSCRYLLMSLHETSAPMPMNAVQRKLAEMKRIKELESNPLYHPYD